MPLRIQKLQILRRGVQFSMLALILLIPAVARYGNYLSARELDKNLAKWEGTLQGHTLAAIDATFRALPEGEEERAGGMARNRKRALERTQLLRGGPWSIQIANLSMTDPLAAVESVAASKRVTRALLISLIAPILITLLLGRVFCSWLCPMHLFLEMTDKLRRLLRFLELPPRNLPFSRLTKYALLFVGIVMSALLALPILGTLYPPALIGRELHDFVFGLFDHAEQGVTGFWLGGLTWMSAIIFAIALFEITLSRRWWCRYVCPGGALWGLIGAKRPIRVKHRVDSCTRCASCVRTCPIGLNPMDDRMGIDCDNCGRCISKCADQALSYGFQINATRPSTLPEEEAHET